MIMSEAAEKRIAELERSLRGTQEMLFLVLAELDEPVVIPAATVKAGINTDKIIDVTLDTQTDSWVFSVQEADHG